MLPAKIGVPFFDDCSCYRVWVLKRFEIINSKIVEGSWKSELLERKEES
jgi:hypothetical protein